LGLNELVAVIESCDVANGLRLSLRQTVEPFVRELERRSLEGDLGAELRALSAASARRVRKFIM
jgi:hypothetical protein